MAETTLVSIDHAHHSSQNTTEITELHSIAKKEKSYGDHLNNTLHQNTSSPHASQGKNWLQSFSPQKAPQNQFIEGFKDCATEVIRFLTEVEKVEDNNPLVMGLQSHLATVSKAFCRESISDLDKLDADIERQKTGTEDNQCINRRNINSGESYSDSSLCVPCLISPIVSRSMNSSVSDSSTVECDVSMSISNTDNSHLSVSSDNNPSLLNSSFEVTHERVVDFTKTDDVFISQELPVEHQQHLTASTHQPAPTSGSNIFPVCHPAQIEQSNKNVDNQKNTSGKLEQQVSNLSKEVVDFPLKIVNTCVSTVSPDPVQCNPPLSHSSPLPAVSSSSNMFSLLDYYNTLQSHPGNVQSESSNLPHFSETPLIYTPVTEPVCHTLLSSCHTLSAQLPVENQTTENNILSGGFPSSQFNTVTEPVSSGGLSQQVNSVLELKANFLPGIDTSSVASGNFADILLAVESCRFHEDPRVRSLADELVHLIHNDDFDDDDEINYDDDEEDVENDIGRENGDESGIEMMDESTDWGNPVDMIEQ